MSKTYIFTLPDGVRINSYHQSCNPKDDKPWWVRLFTRKKWWEVYLTKEQDKKYECHSACGVTIDDAIAECLKHFTTTTSKRYWGIL